MPLYIITWTRLHNGFMKATDNRFVNGFSVSFYSVVNPFVFAAELGKENLCPAPLILQLRKVIDGMKLTRCGSVNKAAENVS